MTAFEVTGDLLSRTYGRGDSAVQAVREVSLTVGAGELVALRGRSGSGKSTLLALFGLLEPPDAGVIRFGGIEVQQLGEGKRAALRRQRIGFVFQRGGLLSTLTALENIAYPLLLMGTSRRAALDRAGELAERLGLSSRANALPNELSGGEYQRAVVARAVAHSPELILADEPTGALDTANAKAVMEALHDAARRGAAVIVATHSEEVSLGATRTVIMRDGALDVGGTL
jgi:ABC-type lipoprotein export system ATPase subunit